MSDTMNGNTGDGAENPSANPSTGDVLKLWQGIKYFKSQEFDDPTAPGSGEKMNIEFIKILDIIRGDCGFAFKIDSGFRSPEHNSQVGGKQASAHLEGCAIDASILDSAQRFAIVKAALIRGIKRIGIGENFIHLDMSFTNPQNVMWLYPKKEA